MKNTLDIIVCALCCVFVFVGCSSTETIPYEDDGVYEIRAFQPSIYTKNGCVKLRDDGSKIVDESAMPMMVLVSRNSERERLHSWDPVRQQWWPDQWSSETEDNWNIPVKNRQEFAGDQRLYPWKNKVTQVSVWNESYERVTILHYWKSFGDVREAFEDEAPEYVGRTYLRDSDGNWYGTTSGKWKQHRVIQAVYPMSDHSGRRIYAPWMEMCEKAYQDFKK